MRTPAPMRSPPSGSSSIRSEGSRLTSTSRSGRGDAELHVVDEVRAAGEERPRGRRARRPARPRRRRRWPARSRSGFIARDRRDRRDDVRVGGAAAEVAAHPLADLLVVELDVVGVEVLGHVARPAGFDLVEHRRPPSRSGPACSSRTGSASWSRNARCTGCRSSPSARPAAVTIVGAVVGHGQGQAAVDAAAVEQDGAGAALAVVTALLGAGDAEMLAQRVEQTWSGCRRSVGARCHRPSG